MALGVAGDQFGVKQGLLADHVAVVDSRIHGQAGYYGAAESGSYIETVGAVVRIDVADAGVGNLVGVSGSCSNLGRSSEAGDGGRDEGEQ